MDPLTLGLMGGTALAGSGLSFLGSQNQAKATQQASQNQLMLGMLGLQAQQAQYTQNRADLSPYRAIGETAGNQLIGQLPSLTQAFDPSQANLEKTPGYQWNLSQGLKAVQNSAAARGLGVSGAAQKGAANYATGLADNTMNSQANIFWNNQNNAYNKLYGVTGLGASAAGATVTAGQNNQNQQTNLLTGMGNTQAGGIMGQAAAQNQGLGAISQGLGSLGSLAYMNQLFGGQRAGMFGGGQTDTFGDIIG